MKFSSRLQEYYNLRKDGFIYPLPIRPLLTKLLTGRMGYSFKKGKHVVFCEKKTGWTSYYKKTKKDERIWVDLHSSIIRILSSISIAYSNKPLNVIDIGGGHGEMFFACKNLCPNIKLNRWLIIEDKNVVDQAKKLILDEKIEIFDSIKLIPTNLEINLIFCSGTLFYTPDPYEIFSHAIKLNPQYISLARTAMTEKNYDIFGVQELTNSNYVPINIVQKFKLISIAERNYDLKFECLEALGAFRISNEPVNMFWLLFKKKQT